MYNEETIPGLIANRIKKYNSKILFQRRDGWSWKQVTWLDFEREVKSVASFLMGLNFGRGDAALVVSSNRIESVLAEIAICFIGGVTVPIAEDENIENIVQCAKDLKTGFIFVGEESVASRILNIPQEIPGLERVFVFSDADTDKDERIIPFKGVLKFGLLKRKQLEDELIKTSKDVSPDSLATIFYSSNSHGRTEKKEITQGGLIQTLRAASEKVSFISEEDQSFSYLPSASPFEKLINHLGIYTGIRIVMAETRKDFFEDILEVKPTVLFETKDGLENICSKIMSRLGHDSPGQRLKSSLGNRVKYVITDSLPRGEIKNFFLKSGMSLIEVPELNNLLP